MKSEETVHLFSAFFLFSVAAFTGLLYLGELDLSNNSLRYFQYGVLEDLYFLKRLSLEDNPWICDYTFITWSIGWSTTPVCPTQVWCAVNQKSSWLAGGKLRQDVQRRLSYRQAAGPGAWHWPDRHHTSGAHSWGRWRGIGPQTLQRA